MTYDAKRTQEYFDAFAEREWGRLEATVQGRVKYAVHRRLIEEYVKPGMRVLDIGSGPGRFAIDIVKCGARVTVADLSSVQLDLARERLVEMHDHVEGFLQLDVLDLSSLEADSFDAVVCYGGVLSYTRERHMEALRQLVRLLKPGGLALVSVMNLIGMVRLLGPIDAAHLLEALDDHLDVQEIASGAGVSYTRLSSPEFHQPLVLFTANGLRAAMREAGLETIDAATSNPLVPEFAPIPRIAQSERATAALIALEVALCKEPGLLDAGGHLLAVARRAN